MSQHCQPPYQLPAHASGPWRRALCRGFPRLLVVAAATMLWLLVTGLPASAHAELVSTSPAAGAHLDRPPAEVTMRFSEPVTPVRDAVRLIDASGHTVSRTEAVTVAGRPDQVTLAVPADLSDGGYLVSWRVLSQDSHPVGGSFAFTIGTVTDVGPLPVAAPDSPDGLVGTAFWLFRSLGYLALVLFGGSPLFLLVCWPEGLTDSRARRLVGIGLAGGLITTVAMIVLQGLWVANETMAHVLDAGLLASTLDTGYGRLGLIRLGLLLLVGGILYRLRGELTRRWQLTGVVGLLVAGACATWAAGGHPRSGDWVPLALAVDTLHLLAVAVWLGGLAVLFACLLTEGRPDLVADAVRVLPRFSRLAVIAVATIVVTGGLQAWRELRDTPITSESNYARVLAFKIATFGLLLCLGAAGRSLVRRRFARAASAPSRANRRRYRDELRDRAALVLMRRSVLLELAIAACVVGLTGALVATSPSPHDHADQVAAAYAGPYTGLLRLRDGTQVRIWMNPARSGQNEVVINIRDAKGAVRDVPEVRLRLIQSELDVDAMSVPLVHTAAGQFTATAMQVPVPGTWQVQVQVRTSDIDAETVTTTVTLV